MSSEQATGSSFRPVNSSQLVRALRRPGQESLRKFSGPSSPSEESDKIFEISLKLGQLSSSNTKEVNLSKVSDSVKSICQSGEDVLKCIDLLFCFGLKNKWNAHVTAVLCSHLHDLTVGEVKFRSVLLKKLQSNYSDRNQKYSQIDRFLSDVILLCELFHHLRLPDGSCYKALAGPIFDYLGMLIEGCTEKEIEIARELMAKCFINLKDCDNEGLEKFLTKIRKKIITESTTGVTVKAMLLEMFELVLNNGISLNDSAKTFYDVLTKPIVNICE